MSEQFGDLRALFQRPPSRRVFQQLILLYPHGRFSPQELEYARAHTSSWPATIRRTLPRSWFSEQRRAFANGIQLCNHIKLGSLDSSARDFGSIDNQIIEVLATSENLHSLRMVSLLDNSDTFSPLDLSPLKYARSLANLEVLESSVQHGTRALLTNPHFKNLRAFKVRVGINDAESLTEAARQSTWFHELVHFELNFHEPGDVVSIQEICGDAYHKFLVWILEGYDFAKLVSLGLNVDPLREDVLQRVVATSSLLPRLERLALQVQRDEDDSINWKTPAVFCSPRLARLDELILDGYWICSETVARLTPLLEQLTALRLYRCDFDEAENWQQHSVLYDILECSAELGYLTISSNTGFSRRDGGLLPFHEEISPTRGIKCTETFEYTDNGTGNHEDMLALFNILDLSDCSNIILDGSEIACWNDGVQNLGFVAGRRLSFGDARMQPDDWKFVISMLRNNKIEKVNVRHNSLSDGVLDLLDFETLRHVGELDMVGCHLGSEYIDELRALHHRRDEGEDAPPGAVVRVLNLCFNELDGEALDLLGEVIDFGAVEHLDLSWNNLELQCVKRFSSFTRLKSLNLSYNWLMEEHSENIEVLLDALPDGLEYLDVSASVERLGDLLALAERFPMLDIDMHGSSSEVPEQERAEIDRWMQHRIFTEAPAGLEVFPWSDQEYLEETTAISEIQQEATSLPGYDPTRDLERVTQNVGHADPYMEAAFGDFNRVLSDRSGPRTESRGWRDVLAYIPDGWEEVVNILERRGLPAPTDTGGELMSGGLTTTTRHVLGWCRPGPDRDVVLVDERSLDAALSYDEIVVSASLEDEATISEAIGLLEQMLSGRSV